VHCAANKRVSVFLGLYRHLRQNRPLDEAFLPRVLIVDPGASNSLGNFREAPYYAFSHSLGRLPQFTTGSYLEI
jgi:hypothetical protein